MKPYSIGIIGAGMYGKVLAGWLQKDKRANVTWINSASESTTRAAAQQFNVPHWTTDYRDILNDSGVEAVVIATPPYLHAEQFEAALAAGKHVLLEKPMAESRASVARILAAAEAAPGRMILEASCRNTRLNPKFTFVKEMIDSGRLGEVYHIHHNHLGRGTFIEYNKAGAWAMDKKLGGGGPFMDIGVYDLSFHLGLLNDVPQLTALHRMLRNDLRDMSKWVGHSDIEQHGAAWLEFDTGLTYYYERGAGVHGETMNETRIQGTRGGLRLQFPMWDSKEVEYFYTVEGEPRKETFTVDFSTAQDNGEALVGHFLDCLDGAAAPLMTVQRAAKHMEILFKILDE